MWDPVSQAEKRGHLPPHSPSTAGSNYSCFKRGACPNPWQEVREEDSVLLQSTLMKTGSLERFPPQQSDFHTEVNSKSTWFSVFTLFVFLTLNPYPLSSLTQCPGEQPPYRRDVCLHEQEQSMLVLPL